MAGVVTGTAIDSVGCDAAGAPVISITTTNDIGTVIPSKCVVPGVSYQYVGEVSAVKIVGAAVALELIATFAPEHQVAPL
jgi:hypothetical protein